MNPNDRIEPVQGYNCFIQTKGQYYHLVFNNGEERMQISSGLRTDQMAKEAVPRRLIEERFEEALRRKREADLAEDVPAEADPTEETIEGSFKDCLEKTYDEIKPGWGKRTAANTRRHKDLILELLTPEIYQRPSLEVSPADYLKVRIGLENHPTIKKSLCQSVYEVQRLTNEMINRGYLKSDCGRVFEGVEAPSRLAKCGEPYRDEDIRNMLEKLPGQSFAVQFLFWVGFSGGPQMIDAATLKLASINRETGKVRLERLKTGGIAEFVLVHDGLVCLSGRSFEASEKYVLHELVYSQKQQRTVPDYKSAPVDLKDKPTYTRISNKVNKLWRKFQTEAGVDSEKSYKSFRQVVTTRLLSSLVSDEAVARVQGNQRLAVRRYDFAENWEFLAMRDLREDHLRAIRSGRMEDYVLTPDQLLTRMQQFLSDYFAGLEALVQMRQTDIENHLREQSAREQGRIADDVLGHEAAEEARFAAVTLRLEGALACLDSLRGRVIDLVGDVLGTGHLDEALAEALQITLGLDRPVTDQELEFWRHRPWPVPPIPRHL